MKNTKRQLPIIGILPDYSNGEENSYSTKSFYAQNCNLVDSVFKANAIPILITYQSKNIDDDCQYSIDCCFIFNSTRRQYYRSRLKRGCWYILESNHY